MKDRSVPTALACIAAFLLAYLWAYNYSTPPEPTRDTAPAPWTPQTSAEAVEVGEP